MKKWIILLLMAFPCSASGFAVWADMSESQRKLATEAKACLQTTDYNCVREAVARGFDPFSSVDENDNHLIHHAVTKGSSSWLIIILELGADQFYCEKFGFSAFHTALAVGAYENAKLMLNDLKKPELRVRLILQKITPRVPDLNDWWAGKDSLSIVVADGDLGMTQYLYNEGAKTSKESVEAAGAIAEFNGNTAIINFLKKGK